MCYKKILWGAAFALCGALLCVLESECAKPDTKTTTIKIKSTVQAKVHLDINGTNKKDLSLVNEDGKPYQEFAPENSWFFSQNERKQKYKYKITAPGGWKLKRDGQNSGIAFGCKVGAGTQGKESSRTYSADMTEPVSITLDNNHKLGITALISETRLISGVWTADLQLEITSDD